MNSFWKGFGSILNILPTKKEYHLYARRRDAKAIRSYFKTVLGNWSKYDKNKEKYINELYNIITDDETDENRLEREANELMTKFEEDEKNDR
ncbi:hypothetical protein M0R19_05385 [Candidatus Pacearchaeota archaeon]|jgi:hypothetical protein|nr:hypothetical protein [Candidatus Pacearchaeota archaeon]